MYYPGRKICFQSNPAVGGVHDQFFPAPTQAQTLRSARENPLRRGCGRSRIKTSRRKCVQRHQDAQKRLNRSSERPLLTPESVQKCPKRSYSPRRLTPRQHGYLLQPGGPPLPAGPAAAWGARSAEPAPARAGPREPGARATSTSRVRSPRMAPRHSRPTHSTHQPSIGPSPRKGEGCPWALGAWRRPLTSPSCRPSCRPSCPPS